MLSKSNIKYIQSLFQKKFRDLEQQYIVEGPKMVGEALLHAADTITEVYALPGWIETQQDFPQNITLTPVDAAELERISQLKTPNEVLAVLQKPVTAPLQLSPQKRYLALDGIQDPGNLGTIIRIADWFGITDILCSPDCAEVYNHKVLQSTMGSVFRVRLHYGHLETCLEAARMPVYGALLNGQPLKAFGQVQGGIIVIGNESKGIRDTVMPLITHKVTIEKSGEAESLNAAVATGIILSHLT